MGVIQQFPANVCTRCCPLLCISTQIAREHTEGANSAVQVLHDVVFDTWPLCAMPLLGLFEGSYV